MKEFKSTDRFKVPNVGNAVSVEYFEGYKDCIGEIIKVDGKIVKVKHAEQFSRGFIPSQTPANIGFIIEEVI